MPSRPAPCPAPGGAAAGQLVLPGTSAVRSPRPADRPPGPLPRGRHAPARRWLATLLHHDAPGTRVSGPASGELTGILARLRTAALTAIGVLVAAASVVSFGESYRGLYEWAGRHDVTGIWRILWPLQVDVFIAAGEFALIVALTDQWRLRSRAGAWTVTAGGLAVSVAGNVGHVAGHSLTDRATAAVPPLAAAAALAVGLGVLKRTVQRHHRPGGQPDATPAAGTGAPASAAAAAAPAPAARPAAAAPATRRSAGRSRPQRTTPARVPVTDQQILDHYAAQLSDGQVPTPKAIRSSWRVGSPRANRLHNLLTAALAAQADGQLAAMLDPGTGSSGPSGNDLTAAASAVNGSSPAPGPAATAGKGPPSP